MLLQISMVGPTLYRWVFSVLGVVSRNRHKSKLSDISAVVARLVHYVFHKTILAKTTDKTSDNSLVAQLNDVMVFYGMRNVNKNHYFIRKNEDEFVHNLW